MSSLVVTCFLSPCKSNRADAGLCSLSGIPAKSMEEYKSDASIAEDLVLDCS